MSSEKLREESGEAKAKQARLPSTSAAPLGGKVALVTGGGGTIGKAIAKALFVQGATVILGGRTAAKLEVAAAEIAAEAAAAVVAGPSSSGSVVARAVDVTSEASVEKLFEGIAREFGTCDIVVNNAGADLGAKPTVEVDLSSFNKILATNVVGPFLCSREAFKLMMKNPGGGRIVNIGSIAAIAPRPNTAAYATSKCALAGLSKSLSLDGRSHKIAVSVVHPGNVLSDMLTPEIVEQRRARGEDFMPAKAVADTVVQICLLPENTTILETTVMPTVSTLVGRG